MDLMGVEPTTPTLQGSVAPNGMQARCAGGPVRESNPYHEIEGLVPCL